MRSYWFGDVEDGRCTPSGGDALAKADRVRSITSMDTYVPPDWELAVACGACRDRADYITKLREVSAGTVSLDVSIGQDGEDGTLVDLLADPEAVDPTEEHTKDDLRDAVSRCLNFLNARELQILQLRFGLGDSKERTLEEVGEQLHVTRERIRQIQNSALAKLRKRLLKEENFPEYFRNLVGRGGLVRLA